MKIKFGVNYLFVICVGLMMFFGSCSKTPTIEPNTLIPMNRESVKAHLDENFIVNDCGKLTHKKYMIPTKMWVAEKLIPYWFEYRKRNNLMYDVNTTSCEAFSFQCHFASQEIEKVNITVGVFFYIPDSKIGTGIGHAINIILINDDNKVKSVFFEPQSSQFVNLSKSEISSCSFWYF